MRLRRSIGPASLALFATTAALLAAATLAWGPQSIELGPLKVSAATATRPVIIGAIAALGLLIAWRRHRGWRGIAIGLLIALAPLAILIGRAPTTYPIGDGAVIELYTLFAVRGQQVLGPYSQYLWHHPGPLSFYVFAPFYRLGALTSFGLGVGVLFVNLGSIAIVAWLVVRDRTTSVPFTLGAFGLLWLFFHRAPGAITSGWNPHTPLMPLVALLFTSAASLAGHRRLLPLATFLTSFIIQTHIGFSMVAGLLFPIAAAPLVADIWLNRERTAAIWSLVGAILLFEVLWALPLAEQLIESPGNMTMIVRFFFNGVREQTLTGAWTAWGTMLAGVFWPGFTLAAGNPLVAGDVVWPRVLGTAFVVLLIPAAILARRGGRTFVACLATAAVVAAAGGFWSVYHIRGPIRDYHIFWLAPLGAVNAAIVASELILITRLSINARVTRLANLAIAALIVAAIGWIGLRPFLGRTNSFTVDAEGAAVRRLTAETLKGLEGWQSKHPIVRFDEGVWAVGSGFVLQLERAGIHVSVAPEMIWLLGKQLEADGTEDVLLTVSRAGRHPDIAQRPHNRTMAEAGTYFIDAVSLIDAPDARPPLK